MGVTNLWHILSPVQQHKPLSSLKGQTIAVDLSIWVCETQCVKQMQGTVSKPFLRNLFFRVSHLLHLGVHLVFVVEGDAPELKWEAMWKRQETRFPRQPGGRENNRRHGRGNFKACLRECCELLDLLGIPHIQSKGEAEAMCAVLNAAGLVDGCITNDGDAFLYGATTVYRNFTMNSKDPHVESYQMFDIKSQLGLDQRKLVAMALLLGCDYLPKGVPGVGMNKAVKLMRSLNHMNVLQRFEKWRSMSDSECVDAVELTVKRKAANVNDFPQCKVTAEFLEVKDKCPGKLSMWKRPKLNDMKEFSLLKLEWPEEYTTEKVLPLITLWDMTSILRGGTTGSNRYMYLKPHSIVKSRVRQGVSCYEIQWFKEVTDTAASDDYYITVEEQELFSQCFPQLVTQFEEEKAARKVKPKGRKKKKNKKKDMDEISEVVHDDAVMSQEKQVTSQECAVITPDSAVITQKENVISQECAVPTPDSAVITQEENVISQECAVITPDSAVITQKENVISQECAVPTPDSAVITPEDLPLDLDIISKGFGNISLKEVRNLDRKKKGNKSQKNSRQVSKQAKVKLKARALSVKDLLSDDDFDDLEAHNDDRDDNMDEDKENDKFLQMSELSIAEDKEEYVPLSQRIKNNLLLNRIHGEASRCRDPHLNNKLHNLSQRSTRQGKGEQYCIQGGDRLNVKRVNSDERSSQAAVSVKPVKYENKGRKIERTKFMEACGKRFKDSVDTVICNKCECKVIGFSQTHSSSEAKSKKSDGNGDCQKGENLSLYGDISKSHVDSGKDHKFQDESIATVLATCSKAFDIPAVTKDGDCSDVKISLGDSHPLQHTSEFISAPCFAGHVHTPNQSRTTSRTLYPSSSSKVHLCPLNESIDLNCSEFGHVGKMYFTKINTPDVSSKLHLSPAQYALLKASTPSGLHSSFFYDYGHSTDFNHSPFQCSNLSSPCLKDSISAGKTRNFEGCKGSPYIQTPGLTHSISYNNNSDVRFDQSKDTSHTCVSFNSTACSIMEYGKFQIESSLLKNLSHQNSVSETPSPVGIRKIFDQSASVSIGSPYLMPKTKYITSECDTSLTFSCSEVEVNQSFFEFTESNVVTKTVKSSDEVCCANDIEEENEISTLPDSESGMIKSPLAAVNTDPVPLVNDPTSHIQRTSGSNNTSSQCFSDMASTRKGNSPMAAVIELSSDDEFESVEVKHLSYTDENCVQSCTSENHSTNSDVKTKHLIGSDEYLKHSSDSDVNMSSLDSSPVALIDRLRQKMRKDSDSLMLKSFMGSRKVSVIPINK